MLLLPLSFLAGMLTVFAPCALPLLPVIIGGSFSGKIEDKKRPYIIIASLIVSVIVFTLALRATTALLVIDPSVWRYISGTIIVALGVVTILPMLWDKMIGELGIQAKTQEMLGAGVRNKGKYVGPVLIGAALGPVFNSCSPTYAFVLASVLPTNFFTGFIYLVAYSLGLGLVLLAVAIWGQKFLSKFKWAADPEGAFRRILGVIFVAVGIAVIFSWDESIRSWIVVNTPIWYTDLDQTLLNRVK